MPAVILSLTCLKTIGRCCHRSALRESCRIPEPTRRLWSSVPRATRKLGGLVRGLNPDAKVNDRKALPKLVFRNIFSISSVWLYMSHCNEFGLRRTRKSMVLCSPSRMLRILKSHSHEKLLTIVEVWTGVDLARLVRAMYRRRVAKTEQSPLSSDQVETVSHQSPCSI